MTDLRRTPSIQHAVALVRETVSATFAEMEKLDAAHISISLNPGRRMFKPLMEGRSLEWVVRQLKRERWEKNVSPNIDLVRAFEPYARTKHVRWFRECVSHGYPIGSGIVIPVRPAGYWAEDGKLHVLWPQCWKGRTLDTVQRSIFNTILRDTFFVGDFTTAELEWIDLREQSPHEGRSIEIVNGEELGTVSKDELAEYLSILIAAFEQHCAAKAKRREEQKALRRRKDQEGPWFGDSLPKDPPK